MPLSNLPPGVRDCDIPGNRPEDLEWDLLYDWIGSVDITPWELQNIIVNWARLNRRGFDEKLPVGEPQADDWPEDPDDTNRL